MPCAPSPPRTFCQLNVVTSSLCQGRSIAKAAEVASQSVRPVRSAAIQSASGTRTPDVVPFQVKQRSRAGSTSSGGKWPYSAVRISASSFSCPTASVTQPEPNDSQASMVTGRAPSIVHIAISKAPVSEAGTMPMR